MGRPKQLLPWEGKPLVVRAVHAALQAEADPVWVVTGAHGVEVAEALRDEPVKLLHNDRFEAGMGSSIRVGFGAAREHPAPASVFLLLCDQPAVDAELLTRMKAAATKSGRGLVACGYAGTVGPPLFVSRRYFADFADTAPETGAKAVLNAYADALAVVPFDAGARDLDKPGDL